MDSHSETPSDGTVVGSWSLESDLRTIHLQWSPVRELLESSARSASRAPAVSGWSCGEHAEHVVTVARWIAGGIGESLGDPSRPNDGAPTPHARPILESGRIPRGVAVSPEAVVPVGRPASDILADLVKTVELWTELGRDTEGLRSCSTRFQHYALGHLTPAEWVRFCAIHTAHHLHIVHDIERALG